MLKFSQKFPEFIAGMWLKIYINYYFRKFAKKVGHVEAHNRNDPLRSSIQYDGDIEEEHLKTFIVKAALPLMVIT